MVRLRDRSLISFAALSAALLSVDGARAQVAPPPSSSPSAPIATAVPAEGATALDTIVVTASTGAKTRLKSSISVTDVSQEQINELSPRSEAEVFRLIPGIRAEDTAGPGGNSNITVRGLPIVTGGSEFVQLQEDGLPVTLFGDMNFANNDYWIRYDSTVSRVEAVRGGSASTLASQAPGAVINYISNTGQHDGGVISVTDALNYDEVRVDGNYGGHINDTLRFDVGGFYKNGDGPLHLDYNAENGYQIKANVTQDLPGGKGYIRLTFKRLDDKEPTFSTSPTLATLNGDEVGNFKPFPGFYAGKQSNQSIYADRYEILDNDGHTQTVEASGIHPKVTAEGLQFHYDVSSNVTVDEKFRYSSMNGVFATQFFNLNPTSGVIGSTVNGAVVGSIVYASGPNKGKLYTSPYINTNPNIYTNMNNMNNYVNDVSASGKYEVPYGRLNAQVGWFHMHQTIDQDWHVNPTYSEASGDNPAPLDLFSGADGTGAQLTAAGQAGFNNNWGDNGSRNYELGYTDDAPYLSLDYAAGPLDLSASLRVDIVGASGEAQQGVPGPNVLATDALGSALLPSVVANSTPEKIDYTVAYPSYSFGALYSLTRNSSVFGRISEGGRANADRLILSGYFNPNGEPNTVGKTRLTNIVDQQEIGYKAQGGFYGSKFNFEATYFFAQTSDSNYDLVSQTEYDNVYHSNGLEVDGGIHYGIFSLYADGTYTHARISKDAIGDTTGNTPLATPTFEFLLSPTIEYKIMALGFTIDGQTSTYADNTDQLEIEGQTYVNAFLKLQLYRGLDFSVNANNLFDTLGYRGRSDGGEVTPGQVTSVGAAGGYDGVFTGSAVLGRTITASLAYRF